MPWIEKDGRVDHRFIGENRPCWTTGGNATSNAANVRLTTTLDLLQMFDKETVFTIGNRLEEPLVFKGPFETFEYSLALFNNLDSGKIA